MASFLDKIKVNTAIEKRVKLDLGCDHITSANFMQYNIAWCKELVPKEKISVSMETFTRLNPMPVPTFGRAKINNRAFFVPFRTIFPGWNDFITDSRHTYADGVITTITSVPVVRNSDLANYIAGQSAPVKDQVKDAYDFEFYRYNSAEDSSTVTKYKLTAKGRQELKVLESLGYKVVFSNVGDTVYSALPLLAMAKVYCDWYYPSQYIGVSGAVNAVEAIFNRDLSTFGILEYADIQNIFNLISSGVCYDSDYFVSAFDNPTGPNSDSYSSFTLKDPQNLGQVKVAGGSSSTSTPFVDSGVGSNSTKLTQWLDDALKSLTDYMKRHQLVGARALDRYLARFGVNLPAEKLRRSVYLGSGYENIQFGDVMSTSDTEGAALGNYAGKGIGYGTSNFDYETDEYGMMIIISSIVPKAGYYQGINRNNLHLSKLDFWTPEFDNLGCQAISKSELYVPFHDMGNIAMADSSTQDLVQGVFGWTPRYAEYKIGRDMLTGDFRYGSVNVGSDAWHTMREVNYDKVVDIVHNPAFVSGADADQYSRIFYNTDADASDKFNVIYHFEIASWSPMKALYDTYEFDQEGPKVVEDANGVKMN